MSGDQLPQGTLVRVTRDLTGSDMLDTMAHPAGFQFEIEEFVTAGDPANGEIAVDFYYGNARGGTNNVAVPADAVEVVRTAEQQRARKLPTMPEIQEFLGGRLLDDCDGFKITETNPDGPLRVEAYGRTAEDLPFGMTLVIEKVWTTDD
jgi:hypothetical protein